MVIPAADRLAACLEEGWRIVRDPLVCVTALDHAGHLTQAAGHAYNGAHGWSDDPDPLVRDLWDLHGALMDMFLHVTGADSVW